MKRSWAVALVALPAAAHVVSMSTGEATLEGSRLDYQIRMPLYEAAHVLDPERRLFENIRFRGADGDARLLRRSCRQEAGNLVCDGAYLFEREVDRFEVRCTFASITVPNHVHLLRAVHGRRVDQAAFDSSFTEAIIRFEPPARFEIAMRDTAAGFWRAIAGTAQWLFLAALVLAGRSRRELAGLAATFLAGESAAALASLSTRLPVSARFIEAAAALTIAWLAVEILLLPEAGRRWAVTGLLGALHGLYFDLLLTAGGYGPLAFLTGVFAAEAAVVVALSALGRNLAIVSRRLAPRLERALALALFVTGLTWFVVRLKS